MMAMWKSIFLLVLVGFVVAAVASSDTSSDETPIDPRFGSTSAHLAREFEKIKRELPHNKLPGTADGIKDTNNWGMDYVISLVKLIGPGFAIALLTILVGVIYGIVKLIRVLCCAKKKEDLDEDDEHPTSYYVKRHYVPLGLYVVFLAFLVTGMAFGIMNNPRFSQGVNDLGGDVVGIGNSTLDLASGLITDLDGIVALIPRSVDGILDQVAGVPAVSKSIEELGNNVTDTSPEVSAITAKVAAIDVGNTTALANVTAQLNHINSSSQAIISQLSNLTYQVSDKLSSSVNNTIDNLGNSMANINNSVDTIVNTANDAVTQADKFVNNVDKYVTKTNHYDGIRKSVVTAIFAVVISVCASFFIGYFLRVKIVLNVVAALGFIFLFLLWFSGSIHFLFGMVLSDSCPVMNTVVEGLLPNSSQAGEVLQGCLYQHRSVLDSLNITAFNLSNVFDYKQDFTDFDNFASSFNFSQIDDYFAQIQALYSYNLSAIADNITVASFGWNQSYIYDALGQLNDQTTPVYYGLNNYTHAPYSTYPYPKNQTVYDIQQNITSLLQINTTAYNKTATAKAQLYSAQNDINHLLANYTMFDDHYIVIKSEVNTLETTNITNCINIIDNLQNNITGFFRLGNCSFVGDAYDKILISICGTMQPAIDLLTIAQFLAGIALIPMTIIAEVMSFRVDEAPRCCRGGGGGRKKDDDDDYVSTKDYVSVKAPPARSKSGTSMVTRPAISATIASSPSSSTDSPRKSQRIQLTSVNSDTPR